NKQVSADSEVFGLVEKPIMNRPGVFAAALMLLVIPLILTAADSVDLTPEQQSVLEKKASELNGQAAQVHQAGQYWRASELLREALGLRQQLYPKGQYPQGHADLAQSLNNLAFVLKAQGEYAKAEPFYRDALQMNQQLYTEISQDPKVPG